MAGYSILDCPVNHEFYEQNDFYPIVAGVPNECFNTPNIAALNMGPLYSSLGAVRYLVDKAGAKGDDGRRVAQAAGQRGGQPGRADLREGEGPEDGQPAGERADLRSRLARAGDRVAGR